LANVVFDVVRSSSRPLLRRRKQRRLRSIRGSCGRRRIFGRRRRSSRRSRAGLPSLWASFTSADTDPCFDIAVDRVSHLVVREFYEAGKTVSAVCHGPGASVSVKLSNGEHLVKDSEVTGFSNAEEDAYSFTDAMPFLLETELKNHGGKVRQGCREWQGWSLGHRAKPAQRRGQWGSSVGSHQKVVEKPRADKDA
ncbi:Glyoxalase 3, partial [Colletotrichum shisoi]